MGYTGPLSDKDRIFTNLYGFQSPDLKAARDRGDWDGTASTTISAPASASAASVVARTPSGSSTPGR